MIFEINKIFIGIIVIGLIIGGAVYFGFRELAQINNQLASLQEQLTPLIEKPLEEPIVTATSTVSEEPVAPEETEPSPEQEANVDPCESLNCNKLDGWNNSGSTFTCKNESNKTCTCQTQAYFDYSCSSSKQKCVYSTTDTRTYKYNCVEPAIPDLIFQSPGFSPANPAAGTEMFFWATIKNQGSGPAIPSSSYLKIDGQKITESSTVSLASGGLIVVAWATGWPAVAGSHEFEVCADGALQVAESNEINNCSKTTFTVGGATTPEGEQVLLPDLIIESVDISPDPVTAGRMVSFSGTVKNKGNAAARPSLTVSRLDLGNDGSWDAFPGSMSTQALAINGTATAIWRSAWTSIVGTHKFEVCADGVSEVELRMAESNKNNNCLSRIIIVP